MDINSLSEGKPSKWQDETFYRNMFLLQQMPKSQLFINTNLLIPCTAV